MFYWRVIWVLAVGLGLSYCQVGRTESPLPAGVIARMGNVPGWPDEPVQIATFSPGDRILALVHRSSVTPWDHTSKKAVCRLVSKDEGTDGAYKVIYSPDGRMLVAQWRKGVDRWGVKRIWEVTTGKELDHLQQAIKTSICLAFSADSKLLAGGQLDGTIKVWEVATGKEIKLLKRNQNSVHAVTFSPDGKSIVYRCDVSAQVIQVWDLASGKVCDRYQGPEYYQGDFVFSSDGKILASKENSYPLNKQGSRETRWGVRLWDGATGQRLHEFPMHAVMSFALSPDGSRLATGGYGGLGCWDTETGQQVWQATFPQDGQSSHYSSVSFSADGKMIAALQNNKVCLWEAQTGKRLPALAGHTLGITSLVFSSDSRRLYSASKDDGIWVWGPWTGRPLATFAEGRSTGSLTLSPDDRTLATTAHGRVYLWETDTGKHLPHILGGYPHIRPTFSSDGKTLTTVDHPTRLRTWDLATGKEVRTIPLGTEIVHFSPDGKTLASIPKVESLFQTSMPKYQPGSSILLRDVSTGKVLQTLETQQRGPHSELAIWGQRDPFEAVHTLRTSVHCLAFSWDGCVLAWHTRDNLVHLWDTVRGTNLGVVPKKNTDFTYTFSPDNRMLVSAGNDKVISLWEVATGKLRHRFPGHEEPVCSLAFSPDSKLLATGDRGGNILIWRPFATHTAPRKESLTAGELQSLWACLGDTDGLRAYHSVSQLMAVPGSSIAFLGEQLRAIRAEDRTSRKIDQHIVDLDSQRYQVRQKAMEELKRLGGLAKPRLEVVFTRKPPLEVRRRVEQLLHEMKDIRTIPSSEWIRVVRAIEVLEYIGNREARQVLSALTHQSTLAWLGIEASLSLERLRRQSRTSP